MLDSEKTIQIRVRSGSPAKSILARMEGGEGSAVSVRTP